MPMIRNAIFRQLAETVCPGMTATSESGFHLVLDDDLVIAVTLHPNQNEVVAQCFAHDLSQQTGVLREAVIDTALRLNHAGVRGAHFAIGLDSRNFLAVIGRRSLSELNADSFEAWIDYLSRQAVRVGELARTVALENAHLTFSLQQPGASA